MKRNEEKANETNGLDDKMLYESTIYDDWYKRKEKLEKPFYYHNERTEKSFVRSIINKFGIKSNYNLLDIGSGNGFYSNVF
jgi:hypothetical protein